jgi:hypothetical protein
LGARAALAVLRATLLGGAHHFSELAADALGLIGPKGMSVLREVAAGDSGAAGIAGRALAAHRALQPSVA